MAELCLVASHGYPPGLFFRPAEQGIRRISKDPLKPSFRILDSNEFFRYDSTILRPVLGDVPDFHPNSLLFSFGIANQFISCEKVLRFLMSRPGEVERNGVDLSLIHDLMGPQGPAMLLHQQPLLPYHGQLFLDVESWPSLISLSSEFCSKKPLFVGDLGHCSEITYDNYNHNDQPSLSCSVTEMEEILSALAELQSSNNSIKWKKQETVVP